MSRFAWQLVATALIAVACSGDGDGDVRPTTAATSAPRSVELFRFKDPQIAESSGVASASYRDDLLFTHNDSGDVARFFAVDFDGNTVATYTVAGARAVDWEDMARGPRQDGSPGQSLYLADIGNNLLQRAVVEVYEVDEPVVGESATTLPLRSTIRLRYPDGAQNAETLLVHPTTGQLVVVAKDGTVYIRRGDALEQVTTLAGVQPTGGAINPRGDRIAIRTYSEILEWRLAGSDFAGGFAAEPVRLPGPVVSQAEALTYTRDGSGLVTTTEGPRGPVHRTS